MSRPRLQIKYAETTDVPGVQAFYTTVGYGCGALPGDRLLVARADQSIIAAVRLCTENGTLVLRGMYVAEERQGQGIGSRLLEAMAKVIGAAECWCLPYSHLTGFYSRIGFCLYEGEEAPPFLTERWRRYVDSGQKVVIMKRPTRYSSSPECSNRHDRTPQQYPEFQPHPSFRYLGTKESLPAVAHRRTNPPSREIPQTCNYRPEVP